MTKIRITSIVIALSIILLTQITAHGEEAQTEDLIIGFENNINLSVFAAIPHEVHHVYDTIQAISVAVPSIYIEEIQNNPEIAWVEKEKTVHISEQTAEWGYTTTVRQETADLNVTGNGIKIGIIDTGVYSEHPDLKIAGGVNIIDGSDSYEDDNGHGTHVAGIIGAQNNTIGILGIAPDAEIYAIKALDKAGEGLLQNVIAGVNWAIDNHMDIVNLSLTTNDPSPAFAEVIQKANEAGIIIVASSGNNGTGEGQTTDDILYPARYPGVIGVGSINEELVHSDFSYTGPSIMFSEPGEDIFSTYIPVDGHEETYATISGTSMAAPYVAGLLALYLELYPELNREEIETILYQNTSDLGDEGKDPLYGYGLLRSPDVPFWDMRHDAWYFTDVNYLINHNFVNGFKDGTFRPDAFISRGEVVTLVGRALGLDGTNQPTAFPDVPENNYASGYIASATEQQIITGFPDKTFKPSAYISRGEVAVIIQRAFQIPDSEKLHFIDVDEKKYYAKAINSLTNQKIITGYPDQTFLPTNEISRAEFSIILAKALDESLR